MVESLVAAPKRRQKLSRRLRVSSVRRAGKSRFGLHLQQTFKRQIQPMARDESDTSSPHIPTEEDASKSYIHTYFHCAHSPIIGADGGTRRNRHRPSQARSPPPIRSSTECGTFCHHTFNCYRCAVYDQQPSLQNRSCCSFLRSIRICSGYLHDGTSGRDICSHRSVSLLLLDVDAFADRLRFTSVQVVFVGGTTGDGGQCQCSQ